eukprot:TRINITY_DN1304_c0_g1_i8.p1 TRINITY_DN1304_c0_g1~~TRINITY_DN1304_c0_g1_i8.p1  ORF type:complete len:1362 (+),score=273.96 TRINITY_DN1304_c0_g1_i8:1233-5318(+)
MSFGPDSVSDAPLFAEIRVSKGSFFGNDDDSSALTTSPPLSLQSPRSTQGIAWSEQSEDHFFARSPPPAISPPFSLQSPRSTQGIAWSEQSEDHFFARSPPPAISPPFSLQSPRSTQGISWSDQSEDNFFARSPPPTISQPTISQPAPVEFRLPQQQQQRYANTTTAYDRTVEFVALAQQQQHDASDTTAVAYDPPVEFRLPQQQPRHYASAPVEFEPQQPQQWHGASETSAAYDDAVEFRLPQQQQHYAETTVAYDPPVEFRLPQQQQQYYASETTAASVEFAPQQTQQWHGATAAFEPPVEFRLPQQQQQHYADTTPAYDRSVEFVPQQTQQWHGTSETPPAYDPPVQFRLPRQLQQHSASAPVEFVPQQPQQQWQGASETRAAYDDAAFRVPPPSPVLQPSWPDHQSFAQSPPMQQHTFHVNAPTNTTNSSERSRNRPPCGLVSMSCTGKVLFFAPQQFGRQSLFEYQMKTLVGHTQHYATLQAFPGPFTGSTSLETVTNFVQRTIEVTPLADDRLLWQLLKTLCSHYGQLSNAVPEILRVLNSEADTTASDSFGTTDFNGTSSALQSALLEGRSEQAWQAACDSGCWNMALLISSHMSPDVFKKTIAMMARQFTVGSPARTLYMAYAGATEELFQGDAAALSSRWHENAAIVLANKSKEASEVLVRLGDVLRQRGRVLAAQCCYLLSERPFERPSATARVWLLGADYKRRATLLTAVQRTELLCYAKARQNPQFVAPRVLPHTLAYAWQLAEVGLTAQASKYADHVSSSARGARGTAAVASAADFLREFLKTGREPSSIIKSVFGWLSGGDTQPSPAAAAHTTTPRRSVQSAGPAAITPPQPSTPTAQQQQTITPTRADAAAASASTMQRSNSQPNVTKVAGAVKSLFSGVGKLFRRQQEDDGGTEMFYYDDVQKRWRKRGEDDTVQAPPPSLPPTTTTAVTAAPAAPIASAPSSEDGAAPLTAAAVTTAAPPMSFSARQTRGGASRYFDVYKGAAATTTTFSAAARPPVAPPAIGVFMPKAPAVTASVWLPPTAPVSDQPSRFGAPEPSESNSTTAATTEADDAYQGYQAPTWGYQAPSTEPFADQQEPREFDATAATTTEAVDAYQGYQAPTWDYQVPSTEPFSDQPPEPREPFATAATTTEADDAYQGYQAPTWGYQAPTTEPFSDQQEPGEPFATAATTTEADDAYQGYQAPTWGYQAPSTEPTAATTEAVDAYQGYQAPKDIRRLLGAIRLHPLSQDIRRPLGTIRLHPLSRQQRPLKQLMHIKDTRHPHGAIKLQPLSRLLISHQSQQNSMQQQQQRPLKQLMHIKDIRRPLGLAKSSYFKMFRHLRVNLKVAHSVDCSARRFWSNVSFVV